MRAHWKLIFLRSLMAGGHLGGLFIGAKAFAMTPPIEEVVVKGTRASVDRSIHVKREAKSIVEAIAREDIGKFPDTNLAEALQRLPGVSISRDGGEGKFVTVRGFGSEYNMVTLNGRMLPAADAFGAYDGAMRSFNMADLSADAVDLVKVYKAGQADKSSGGLGGTVDIITTKPLATEGVLAGFSSKLLRDLSSQSGKGYTPDFSGMVSWSNSIFGASLNASHSRRDSGSASAGVVDWRIQPWVSEGEVGAVNILPGGAIINRPEVGSLYALPTDISYTIADRNRERSNAQLTLQYKPLDSLQITTDFTAAQNDIVERRASMNVWHSQTPNAIVFENNAALPSSALYAEDYLGTISATHTQRLLKRSNRLRSAGLNIAWQATESLAFSLDAHDSKTESLPDHETGGGLVSMHIGTPVVADMAVQHNTTLPVLNYTVKDGVPLLNAAGEQVFLNDSGEAVSADAVDAIPQYEGRGNGNGQLDAADFGTQHGAILYNAQTSEVAQLKLDGTLAYEEGEIKFGVEARDMATHRQRSERFMTFGDWSVANPGEIPEALLERVCIACEFEHRNADQAIQVAYRGDAEEILRWAIDDYGVGAYVYEPDFDEDHKVAEKTKAVFIQLHQKSDINGWPTNFLVGARYERTDVASTSGLRTPLQVSWTDANNFHIERELNKTAYTDKADYDFLLPSFSADITFYEGIKARISYSKTIGRARYGDLAAESAVSVGAPWGPTLLGSKGSAFQANPGLIPLESNNFDLAVEWYFSEASIASIGIFEKRVKNFIGAAQEDMQFFGLRDPSGGPRAEAAYAAITARDDHDGVVDGTELFVMTAVLDNPMDFPGGVDDYKNNPTFFQRVLGDYDIAPNEDDPEMVFVTTRKVNNREAKIHGFELTLSHFFGESGFGVMANYTTVKGDLNFDNLALPSQSQFALLGLSDSANLVLMYDNGKYSGRIAYNWRDKYLRHGGIGFYRNPRYVEEYGQVDLNANVSVNERLNVSLEVINLFGDYSREYGRTATHLFNYTAHKPRLSLGFRYNY